jgi:hypothetical protein
LDHQRARRQCARGVRQDEHGRRPARHHRFPHRKGTPSAAAVARVGRPADPPSVTHAVTHARTVCTTHRASRGSRRGPSWTSSACAAPTRASSSSRTAKCRVRGPRKPGRAWLARGHGTHRGRSSAGLRGERPRRGGQGRIRPHEWPRPGAPRPGRRTPGVRAVLPAAGGATECAASLTPPAPG